ncbi:MAG TPA: hypothetical protein VK111_04075 [Virgibacillus sp.]|nr:hypothetical protein [Virgibacillus sp.]
MFQESRDVRHTRDIHLVPVYGLYAILMRSLFPDMTSSLSP